MIDVVRSIDEDMDYHVNINGYDVEAHFSQDSIDHIYIPLLRRLTRMQQEKGGRILVMLAAPPAAGKSTLVSFLKYLSEHTEGVTPINVIGMDGFHRYQDELLSHTIERDGKTICMVDVKGAPETFDLEKLTKAVQRVAAGECVGWPDYSRPLHNPIEDALSVDGEIVLLEGNYLLLDWPGWRELKNDADYTISIEADLEVLRDRLLERKLAGGTDYEKAVAFVENSDLYNARTCLKYSMEADMTIRV